MLLEGIPALNTPATPNHSAPASKKSPAAKLALASSAAAANAKAGKRPASTVVTVPVSKANEASLCRVGALPSCAKSAPVVSLSAPPPSDPISSWTNITPPSGSPNVAFVEDAAMSYFPAGHDNILFGGYGDPYSSVPVPVEDLQDTWSFANNRWTELISNATCTPATCPAPREGAMLTYYPTENALLLFGGYNYSSVTETESYFNDTWLFENGAWTNISSTAGAAPPARFWGSMIWDPLFSAILLFGGFSSSGTTLGDTWFFEAGTWLNVTPFLGGVNGYKAYPMTAPEPRYQAAIAENPAGIIMLYGGADDGVTIENNCDLGAFYGTGDSTVGWWFNATGWYPMNVTENGGAYCAPIASPLHPAAPAAPAGVTGAPAADPNCNSNPGIFCSQYAPCGRTDPALGWSIKNDRFVLYGGYGANVMAACTGSTYLNDTWLFRLPAMSNLNSETWGNVSDSGDPSARDAVGYSTDYTDNYFEITGGLGTNPYEPIFNSTYRFYAVVHARLSGPSDILTVGPYFAVPFIVDAYGGSGDLVYDFAIQGIRNGHTIPDADGCGPLVAPSTGAYAPYYSLPYTGMVTINCAPPQSSYNIYRLTLTVVDWLNQSDTATANLVFTVTPSETMVIYSEYQQYFYSDVSFDNTFTLTAIVAGTPATSISATLDGSPVTFVQQSNPDHWTITPNMAHVAPGSIIKAEGFFAGWTLNATFYIDMITTPSWLVTLFNFAGATQTISSQGAGPYNKTFTIDEAFDWNVGQALGVSLPIPLVSGAYDLIPDVKVHFQANSSGDISLIGTLSLTPPSIDIGAFELKITASFTLQGSFALSTTGSDVTGIQWLSASATVSVTGDFSGSVPLYGFSILGVTIGFVLDVSINPSITLTMVLAPATNGNDLIPGVGVAISRFFGSFTLPLSVSVNFGIGIASVGIGGSISVAVQFQLNPGIEVSGGWVNGTIFVQASALCWSTSWNIASGTIYSWGSAGAALAALGLDTIPYNNGTGVPWSLNPRYYVGPGYDQDVWSPTGTQGPAISDVYPYTEVTGAAGYNGAYLFYSDDNASQSPSKGLEVSALRLDPSTNALDRVAMPTVPNFVISNPKAMTLPDGNLYVVWDALPASEATLSSPLQLTSMDLQGAEFYPSSQTWGAVKTYSTWDIPQSFQVDATGTTGQIVALMAASPLLGDTTPERLVEYDIASGNELGNVSVSRLTEVASLRGASNEALVLNFGNNYSTVDLQTGNQAALAYTPPAGYSLLSASFATGSASTLVLLYRGNATGLLVLYDASTGQTIAADNVTGAASAALGVSNGPLYYVFVSTAKGLQSFTEADGGPFQNGSAVNETGIDSFGVVQAGTSLLVYSVATTGMKNATEPIKALDLTEVSAALPVIPGRPSPTTTPAGQSPLDYAIYLGIVAAAMAVILAVIAIRGRRPPRQITAVPTGAGDASTPPASSGPPSSPPPPSG